MTPALSKRAAGTLRSLLNTGPANDRITRGSVKHASMPASNRAWAVLNTRSRRRLANKSGKPKRRRPSAGVTASAAKQSRSRRGGQAEPDQWRNTDITERATRRDTKKQTREASPAPTTPIKDAAEAGEAKPAVGGLRAADGLGCLGQLGGQPAHDARERGFDVAAEHNRERNHDRTKQRVLNERQTAQRTAQTNLRNRVRNEQHGNCE